MYKQLSFKDLARTALSLNKEEEKFRRMRLAGHVARIGGEERRIQDFGGEI